MIRAGVLAALLLATAPSLADAQLFLASRPHPEFEVGPLFVRARVSPALDPVTIDLFFSLAVLPGRNPALDQDLYLLWPGAVGGIAGGHPPDTALARFIEARGFTALEEGRLPLFSRNLYSGGEAGGEPIPGGASFVSFVRANGALGLTTPVTYIRIPWTPKLVNRALIMDLRLTMRGLVKARPATWVEEAFWGRRHRISISFNDVRGRALFPLYFEHRDRVVRLADDPSQLLLNFSDADHLKIDQVSPPAASRQLSESQESTEVVSLFIDRSEGLAPQVLTVQFGYFSGLQAWTPILIPMLFFVLGNVAGPLVTTLVRRLSRSLASRVQVRRPNLADAGKARGVVIPRETLARIAPGETTFDQLVKLCGPDFEEHQQLAAPDRRVVVYRGQWLVPRHGRRFGWLTTVSRWDIEYHEVEIELERDLVRDVQARVRRSRLTSPEPG